MVNWALIIQNAAGALIVALVIWVVNTLGRLNRVCTAFEVDQKDMGEVKAQLKALSDSFSHLSSEFAALRGAFEESRRK